MIKIRIGHQLLLLFILAFVSGCNDSDTVKFDKGVSGTGGSSQDGGNNPGHTPTPPNSTFAGLNSIGDKTDSTVTLYWTPHADAINYLIYDSTSGSPVLLQTVSNPTANYIILRGLTADVNYKFIVRMENSSNEIDSNTRELSVTMNHSPEAPTTPVLHTPSTSPSRVNRPTFTVNGVKAGDIVSLYQDDAICNSTAVASGTVGAGQTSIELQLTNALIVGGQTYTFYADAINASGHHSNCSAGVDYEFQKLNCPNNYVPVLGNVSIGTSEFCVAKYEMKCVNSVTGNQCSGNADHISKVATSQPNFTPWVSIRADNSAGGGAWKACNDLNGVLSGTFALISNAEWMTIARDLQTVPENWDGGVVGTNGIARGNSDGSSALPAAADTAPCTGTSGSCTDLTWHINKRTHKLPDDSIIWDFGANVREWIDWSPNGTSYSGAPTDCDNGYINEFTTSCVSLSANQYLPHPIYTSAQNFGRWVGGTGGAALRGGFWGQGAQAGIYTLGLSNAPSDAATGIGFRCVYRP